MLKALALSLLQDGQTTPHEWVQVALTGQWRGHARPFELTVKHLQQMAANFHRYSGGRVVFDFEHQTLRSKSNGQPAPAAGWGLEVRVVATDDGGHALEVRPEWTQATATAIGNREYLYLSPVILFDRRDKRTGAPIGAVLHSVALTNSPFLEGLPAIAASDDPASEIETMELLPSLCAILALSTTSTADDALGRVRALSAGASDVRARLGLPLTATDAEVTSAVEALQANAKVGEVALSHLPDGTTAEAAVTALPPALGHAGYVALSDHDAVKTELAELKAGSLVDQAEAAGKVTQAQRDWLKGWALSDLAAAEKWVESAPVSFPGAAKDRKGPAAGAAGGSAVALTDEQSSVAGQLGLTDAEYAEQLAADK